MRAPRKARQQNSRQAVAMEETEQFYRKEVFIPFIDTTIAQLNARFSSHFMAASSLMYLLPWKCVDASKLFKIFQVLYQFKKY